MAYQQHTLCWGSVRSYKGFKTISEFHPLCNYEVMALEKPGSQPLPAWSCFAIRVTYPTSLTRLAGNDTYLCLQPEPFHLSLVLLHVNEEDSRVFVTWMTTVLIHVSPYSLTLFHFWCKLSPGRNEPEYLETWGKLLNESTDNRKCWKKYSFMASNKYTFVDGFP